MTPRLLSRFALFACLVLGVGLVADAFFPAGNGFLGYDDARTSVSPELTEDVRWFPGRGIARACRRIHQRRLSRGVAVFGQRRYNAACSSCAPQSYQYVAPQPRYQPATPNVVYDYPNQVVNIGSTAGTCNPNCPHCGGRGCQGNCQCPPTCYTLPSGAKVCVPCRQPATAATPAVVQTIGATAEASPAKEELARSHDIRTIIGYCRSSPSLRPLVLKVLEDNVLTKAEHRQVLDEAGRLLHEKADSEVQADIDAFRAAGAAQPPLVPATR